MKKNVFHSLLILFLLAVLTACSFKTFYNRLDYLIPEYVEGMVSLDDVLEEKVRQGSWALLSWHRKTQLRQYADWLRGLQQDVADGLTEQQAQRHIEQVHTFWLALSSKVNQQMAQLLPLLDQQQQDELFASLAEDNEEYRQEYLQLDAEQRLENYRERLLDNYENWLGELSDAQRLAIEQAAAQLQSSAELRLQRRLLWQQGIHRILDAAVPVQQKTTQLETFLAGYEQQNNPLLRDIRDNNRHVIARLTVQLAQAMTEAQRQHFISETDDYIRMFAELAEDAPQ